MHLSRRRLEILASMSFTHLGIRFHSLRVDKNQKEEKVNENVFANVKTICFQSLSLRVKN